MDKVVIRLNDGDILKGHLIDFSPKSSKLSFSETRDKAKSQIDIQKVKAVFFVKKFKGKRSYDEKKTYSGQGSQKKKVFVKFKDGEALTGYLEGPTPWKTGFFLSSGSKLKGFFLMPADKESNNSKVFIINSSVQSVTVVPI